VCGVCGFVCVRVDLRSSLQEWHPTTPLHRERPCAPFERLSQPVHVCVVCGFVCVRVDLRSSLQEWHLTKQSHRDRPCAPFELLYRPVCVCDFWYLCVCVSTCVFLYRSGTSRRAHTEMTHAYPMHGFPRVYMCVLCDLAFIV